jgi:AcrR family transcriptional regulator
MASGKVTQHARQRLKPEIRRERLLEAAASVFAERGYEAARIEQVADAAGVSPGLLYRHFAGKKDLYAELVQRADMELLEHLAEAAAPGPPSRSRLEHGVDAVLAFIEEHPDLWQMLARDVVDPDIKALRDAAHAHAVTVVARQIELDPDFERQGVSDLGIERMATLIVGATTSLAQWWTDHPGIPRAEVLTTLMGVLWLGFDRLREGERYQVDLTPG